MQSCVVECRFNKLLWDCSHNNFGVRAACACSAPALALLTQMQPMQLMHDICRRSGGDVTVHAGGAPPALIRETKAFLHAMLRLRYSSPLFRLPAAAILDQVRTAHVLGLPRKHALPPCAAPRWVSANAQYAWVGAGR